MDNLTKVSLPTIGFYVHHHGGGHVMRAITIAHALKGFPICFMGSNLKPYTHLIPDDITCIDLPMDLPAENETSIPEKPLSFMHYAPLGLKGIGERTLLMAATFQQNYPMLLIVDVSVEITILARLCSIPTVVVKQHGNRSDIPHLQAYESAELLLAPFSAGMAPVKEADWIKEKTIYTGGFSRYSNKRCTEQKEEPGNIGVLTGEGGTSINAGFIHFLATSCPDYTFHVMGSIADGITNKTQNIKWQGRLPDPQTILNRCTVVIGNAGHNTVMEMADLNKRFICIPEERPFDEQQQKAELLFINGNATVVQPSRLLIADWPYLLATSEQEPADWSGVTDTCAMDRIREAINATVKRLFSVS